MYEHEAESGHKRFVFKNRPFESHIIMVSLLQVFGLGNSSFSYVD